VITLTKVGRALLAALVALASVQLAAAGGVQATGPRIDTHIQGLIERTVIAIVHNDADLPSHFEALRDPGLEKETVLLQLALYLERSTGTEQSMGGALILQHLEFTPEEKIRTIVPHLDAAGPRLRHVFTDLLGTIDRPEGGKPDFRLYEPYLAKVKESPPWAFIRYLYEVSPDAALASMERLYSGGPAHAESATGNLDELRRLLTARGPGTEWSERDRARVQATLETLGRDPGWWRRLYAATILAGNPNLVTPDLTRQLRSDANPLVRSTLPR